MRLNRLEVQGFGAFREPTSFDFEDAEFFALVGPTGSGKSTVIDAVCFALYGCVPRYEDQRLNRYVVTLGASEAKVSLDFEFSGARYTAARVVRRNAKGQVSTKEARLERHEDDGTISTLAGAERELNQAVEALLRLSFKHFTRSVVLPQGEFAEFLRAKGEERRDLLIRLLNFEIYQRVGQRAGKVADTALTEIGLWRQQLEPLANTTPELLRSAKARATALTKLIKEIETARPKIDQQLRDADDQDRAATEARRLADLLGWITVPEEAQRHGAEQTQATAELDAAKKSLLATRKKRTDAEQAAKKRPALADLVTASQTHKRLAELATDLDREQALATDAREETETAGLDNEQKQKTLAVAESELEHTRASLQAANLAQLLVVGEPCPVCFEAVKTIPDHTPAMELAKAQTAAEQAKKKVSESQTKHREASSTLAEHTAKVDTLVAEKTRLVKQVKVHPDAAALQELVAEVTAQQRALDDARREEEDAALLSEAAQKKVDELASAETIYEGSYGAQRDGVASLGPPDAGKGSVLANWQALADWASPTKTAQEEAAATADAKALEQRQAAHAATQNVLERAAALDVSAEDDIIAVLAAVTGASVKAAEGVALIKQAIETREQLEQQIAEANERSQVASALRTHLRADHFPEWLISEALELLVADASTTLRALTNDTFSLTLGDKEFMVIDHANADEQRSARTLSGGETFQASLALALALSDQIRGLAADGAPELNALFLDEGFGTLDQETLETVASTIENLGQGERMVGIISHVQDLANRVPVRFEIRKGARSATVEKIYA